MSSLKLLIVEDDAPSLELMEEVFTSLKAHVYPVNDGLKAAALLNKERFDGVFLDLEMPRMHGFDLARQVRESSWNRYTPIVIVTGSDDRSTMQRAFANGANFYLQKPIDRQRLSSLFRAVRGSLIESQRRNTRVPLHAEVICDLDSKVTRGTCWNLSQGGMQVEATGLKPKDILHVSFRLPTSGVMIEAFGVVVWVTESRQGIQFSKMNSQTTTTIREFIAEVERSDWISR
jgi:two-component system cell cycle response regulator CtrA